MRAAVPAVPFALSAPAAQRPRSRRALVAFLLACAPAAAHAEPPALQYDLRVDATVTVAATAFWVGTELAKGSLAPTSCRFCQPNALDAGVRNALVWPAIDRASRASDVFAMAVIPAGVAAHQLLAARAEGDGEAGFVDLLIVAEATALAMDVNQIVKFAVGRQRPFVHYGNHPPDRQPDPDDNLSFFSGHTTLAFSLASAAGSVSSLRGYRSTPWVWGVGMTLAATVGYLRIAADRHYLTDVLAGAAVGTAAGIALPRLFHGRKDDPSAPAASFQALPLGVTVVF